MTALNFAKSAALLAALILGAQALSACRPMYGTTSTGSSVVGEMAAVSVETIPGRVGQKIRNELIFRMTGGMDPAVPQYKLVVAIRESKQGVLFKRTEDSSGKIYSIDARFTLFDAAGKTEVMKGRSHARAAFDKHESGFANVRAEIDAQDRAARDIAKDITNRVAAHISSYN